MCLNVFPKSQQNLCGRVFNKFTGSSPVFCEFYEILRATILQNTSPENCCCQWRRSIFESTIPRNASFWRKRLRLWNAEVVSKEIFLFYLFILKRIIRKKSLLKQFVETMSNFLPNVFKFRENPQWLYRLFLKVCIALKFRIIFKLIYNYPADVLKNENLFPYF